MLEKNLAVLESNCWEAHCFLSNYKSNIIQNFTNSNIPKEKIENFSNSFSKLGNVPGTLKPGTKSKKLDEVLEYISTPNQYSENQTVFNSFPKKVFLCEKKGAKVLSLSHFKLSFIEGFEVFYQTLNTLDLSNNQLTEIPNSIYLLFSLKNLDLSKNNITKIEPNLVSFLGKLDQLNVADNPFEGIFSFLSSCSKEHSKMFLTNLEACKLYQG